MNRFELWDKVARCRLPQHFRLLVALWVGLPAACRCAQQQPEVQSKVDLLSDPSATAAESTVQVEHRLNLARQIQKMATRIDRWFLATSDPLFHIIYLLHKTLLQECEYLGKWRHLWSRGYAVWLLVQFQAHWQCQHSTAACEREFSQMNQTDVYCWINNTHQSETLHSNVTLFTLL